SPTTISCATAAKPNARRRVGRDSRARNIRSRTATSSIFASMSEADLRAASERIHGHVLRTPLQTSSILSRMAGAEIHLKCENLQKTGSFKARGALNRILSRSGAERRRSVIAASAGNHAQGVAYAAAIAGVKAT